MILMAAPISWARNSLNSDPGACAPGFMLAPASQAKTALLVQSSLGLLILHGDLELLQFAIGQFV